MPRPATSTPQPLARMREHGKNRTAISLAAVDGTAVADGKRGRVPAKTIQKDGAPLSRRKTIQNDEAPRARRKPIQVDETSALTRQGMRARIEALHVEIRSLIVDITQAADVVLLDLMRDEVGSYASHKLAQDARTWAASAGITLETGLMQLGRALPAQQT
ncbi:hypothetical protein bgla_1g10690 [Burkholderia gladioli BSR3]|uniref:Uncharacterized protein n=2 Tax=Burkholderia gladioli TaxID=28095 RepID=F2L9I9_BURGS|nr:hypothetical protein bgla_1g10690 [Burkholderia gladioli BSR3]